MPFDLPRRPVALRFTGAMKALGQERPKAPPPSRRALGGGEAAPGSEHFSSPSEAMRAARPPTDVYVQDLQPTPYVGARPSERAERAALPAIVASGAAPMSAVDQAAAHLASLEPKITTVRGALVSYDDDVETIALGRDDFDLDGVTPKAQPRPPGPNLPVPGFRSVAQMPSRTDPTLHVRAQPPSRVGLSLTAWFCVALIAAVLSYRFAPEALTGLEDAVRVLAGR